MGLIRQDEVERFFAIEKPQYVFQPTGKVGRIEANQRNIADFLYENMVLEMNAIHAAFIKLKDGIRFAHKDFLWGGKVLGKS